MDYIFRKNEIKDCLGEISKYENGASDIKGIYYYGGILTGKSFMVVGLIIRKTGSYSV